jgi:large subunit ribosomal protein L10
MKKSDKPLVVADLVKSINESKSVTVINYQGLPNSALGALRQSIRDAGGSFIVAKNTLVKRALEETGHKLDATAEEGLNGPTAVVFAQTDEIAPLQLIGKSIKESELPKLKFGVFNSEFLDADKLDTLSKLPGKNVLYGQLLSTLSGPAYGLVGTLNANLQMLVYVLSQREKQLGSQAQA